MALEITESKGKVTISGSFRKFYQQITQAMITFSDRQISVLSPAQSKIINPGDEFVVFESDESNDVRTLEDKHLQAIRNSDILYIVNPGGYVGKSAIFEMGYAVALEKPIFATEPIEDQTLTAYVDGVTEPNQLVMTTMKDRLVLPKNPTLQRFQEYILKMVKERGFDKETPKDILVLLTEELGELARAVRKSEGLKMADDTKRSKVEEELTDCFIYLLDLANQYGIDLEQTFREKEEKNKQRNWE